MNHGWEDIDFLHPSMYGRVIGKDGKHRKKLEDQFKVNLRYNKETIKLQIKGNRQDKEDIVGYLRSHFQSPAGYGPWETIFDSTWDNFPILMKKIDKNQSHWKRKYGIEITIDPHKKEISIRGPKDNKIKFKLNVYRQMMENEQIGTRDVFCIGLGEDDYIDVQQTNPNEDKFNISTEHSIGSMDLYDIYTFKDVFLDALVKAKKNIKEMSKKSKCFIMLHGGVVFSKLKPGRYTKKEVFSDDNSLLPYCRLNNRNLKIDALDGFQELRRIYRYDIAIFTPEPHIKIRYKLYLNDDHTKFITCEDAGDRKPRFQNVKSGPGSFEYPEKKFTRLDIVDPRNGLTTRLSVSACQEDLDYQRKLEFHHKKLRNVLENIKITRYNTLDISLPEMPTGYIVSFLRRAERMDYTIRNESTLIGTSSEELLLDYESSDSKDVMGIFFKDRDIDNTLASSDWQPEDIMKTYEMVLKRGHDFMQYLFGV